MNSMKTEESCVENKQSLTASGSSISEGSSGFSTLSPACSPATSSPNHRRTSGPIRRAKGGWTPIEDETLRLAVEMHKGRNWKKIAESVPGRTEVQCLHRWQKVLNPELIKGPWTPEEDSVIVDLVAKYGPTKWSIIAGSLPGRIGKQCRERWHNHLNPEIRKDAWTSEEEMELMKAHFHHGNKWAEIAKMLPGRSDNSIKNHWNSSLRKRSEVYAKTGKFLHAQKPTFQNTAKDSDNSRNRRLFYCSGNELHTGGDNAVLENPSAILYSSAFETPKAVRQKVGVTTILSAQISLLDETIRLSDCSNSGENFDACSFNKKGSQNEELIETKLYSSPDNIGSLCYKPPQLEDIGASLTHPLFQHESMQPADRETSSSPISYSTPSSVNAMSYAPKSVESILKVAARSFPNTPSIIKRRKEMQMPFSAETLHTIESRTPESCSPKLSNLFSSPLDYTNNLNFTPVYRLRSKRKTAFKSLEKQLDFTGEDANLVSTTTVSSLVVNKNSCSPTNMQFLSI